MFKAILALSSTLQPTCQHNKPVHTFYESLGDKVGNHSIEHQLAVTARIDPLNLDYSPSVFTYDRRAYLTRTLIFNILISGSPSYLAFDFRFVNKSRDASRASPLDLD